MSRWTARTNHPARFARFVVARFLRDECPATAAALSYTSLLALVPLMAVTLAVISAFPVFEQASRILQDFLFENFVPTAGELLHEHMRRFSANASKLSGPGILSLVVVALLLMQSIDRAFNRIWRARQKRTRVQKFLTYWAALTLGPMLIGVSILVSSYLLSLPMLSKTSSALGLDKLLLVVSPFLASWLAFTLLYQVVPNRRVRFAHAFTGGLIASLLFELSKHAFGLYIENFPTYQAIYGALATIPIFLVWLYLSWLVTLLGAETTYALGVYPYHAGKRHADHRVDLRHAVRVLARLRQAQQRGRTMKLESLASGDIRLLEEDLEDLLYRLRDAGWLSRCEDGGWAVIKDLDTATIRELRDTTRLPLPEPERLHGSPFFSELERCLDQRLETPLHPLFDEAGERPTQPEER